MNPQQNMFYILCVCARMYICASLPCDVCVCVCVCVSVWVRDGVAHCNETPS